MRSGRVDPIACFALGVDRRGDACHHHEPALGRPLRPLDATGTRNRGQVEATISCHSKTPDLLHRGAGVRRAARSWHS